VPSRNSKSVSQSDKFGGKTSTLEKRKKDNRKLFNVESSTSKDEDGELRS